MLNTIRMMLDTMQSILSKWWSREWAMSLNYGILWNLILCGKLWCWSIDTGIPKWNDDSMQLYDDNA